jgi:hypothetical protein
MLAARGRDGAIPAEFVSTKSAIGDDPPPVRLPTLGQKDVSDNALDSTAATGDRALEVCGEASKMIAGAQLAFNAIK